MHEVEYRTCQHCGTETLHTFSDNHDAWYCVFSWTHEAFCEEKGGNNNE